MRTLFLHIVALIGLSSGQALAQTAAEELPLANPSVVPAEAYSPGLEPATLTAPSVRVAYLCIKADWAQSPHVQKEMEDIRKTVEKFIGFRKDDALPIFMQKTIGTETEPIAMPPEEFIARIKWLKEHELFVSSQVGDAAGKLQLELPLPEIAVKSLKSVFTSETRFQWTLDGTTIGTITRTLLGNSKPLSMQDQIAITPEGIEDDLFVWTADRAKCMTGAIQSQKVAMTPFFFLSRDKAIAESRRNSGFIDLIVTFPADHGDVAKVFTQEFAKDGGSPLDVTPLPGPYGITEFRTMNDPENLTANTTPNSKVVSNAKSESDSSPLFAESPSTTARSNVADDELDSLRLKLQQLETSAHAGSAILGRSNTNRDEQTRAIREQVQQAFDLRQRLQRLEAQLLRTKLHRIDENLAAREKNREAIIDRRVQEIVSLDAETLTENSSPQRFPGVELLCFTARYAQPCQKLIPRLEQLKELGYPIRVSDITENPDEARRYSIDRVPTCVLKVNGKEIRRFVGLISDAELRREFDSVPGIRDVTSFEVTPVHDDEPGNLPGLPEQPSELPVLPAESAPKAILTLRQPNEIVEQLRKFRNSYDSTNQEYLTLTKGLEEISQPLSELKSAGVVTDSFTEDDRQRMISGQKSTLAYSKTRRQRALNDWQREWSNYQTQMRLLQLDIDEATATRDMAGEKLDRVDALVEKSVVPESELGEAMTEHRTASGRLERARQIHALYREIEANEKELLPPAPEDSADATEKMQTY